MDIETSIAAAKRAVVDRDVVLRKSEAVEHHASRLHAKLPLPAGSQGPRACAT